MTNMEKLAEHILAVAGLNDKSVTNAHLQKIMYFVLKNIDYNAAKNIYDTPFYVWRYGPIAKVIYDKYMIFVTTRIFEKGIYHREYQTLDDQIIKLLDISVDDLIKESRKEQFWQDNKNKIVLSTSNVEYTLKDVQKVYK